MAVESVEAAAESSILPGNNQNMDLYTIRSGTGVAAVERVPGEQPPVVVGGKYCMEAGMVGIYRKREEEQWCNNMRVDW